jgi:putative transposase
MPRIPRVDKSSLYYHVINRASARLTLFSDKKEYGLFESVLVEAQKKFEMRIISYICMPNHFHMILFPERDGDISKFMYWFTMTLTARWHAIHKTTGSGHIFQGRYKSFLIEPSQLLKVVRYIERNALRASLIKNAEGWKYSSLYRRLKGSKKQKSFLYAPKGFFPKDYLSFVQEPLTLNEMESIRNSVNRGTPFGSKSWQEKMVDKFKLQASVRKRGRPKKGS